MHPYRYAARAVCPDVAIAAASQRERPTDVLGPLLLSAGGLVMLGGVLVADGTELAIGSLMVMAALRRVGSSTRNPT
jgi:hypothetical protein